MSKSKEQPPQKLAHDEAGADSEKSRPLTLIVQLVVIPLAVVLFCVALGGMFVWLTSERKDVNDYVGALRASSGARRTQQAQFLLNYIQDSKRWQGIFDVTAQMSADREAFLLKNPNAVAIISQVFDEAKDQDSKTRRYLSLVLGLLGDKDSIPRLRAGLDDADPETVKNCLWALGRMGDDGSVTRTMGLARHEEPSVRMMAMYVLGSVNDPQARSVLVAALNDPDVLVTWNAAFGLARQGDAAGREVLERLLDKAYVDRVTLAMAKNNQAPLPENLQRYRSAAVVWLAKLDPEGAKPLLEKLSVNEVDLVVRNAALQQLNELKKK